MSCHVVNSHHEVHLESPIVLVASCNILWTVIINGMNGHHFIPKIYNGLKCMGYLFWIPYPYDLITQYFMYFYWNIIHVKETSCADRNVIKCTNSTIHSSIVWIECDSDNGHLLCRSRKYHLLWRWSNKVDLDEMWFVLADPAIHLILWIDFVISIGSNSRSIILYCSSFLFYFEVLQKILSEAYIFYDQTKTIGMDNKGRPSGQSWRHNTQQRSLPFTFSLVHDQSSTLSYPIQLSH